MNLIKLKVGSVLFMDTLDQEEVEEAFNNLED